MGVKRGSLQSLFYFIGKCSNMSKEVKMRKVYVVNKSFHDYTSAKEFGELVFLTEGKLNPYDINHMARLVEERMKESRKNDLILVTSLSSLCMVAGAHFAMKHGRLNLLLIIPKRRKYIERNIILKTKEKETA